MPDSTPTLYDDSGAEIQTVTVEATRLPNWVPFILVSLALYLLDEYLEGDL